MHCLNEKNKLYTYMNHYTDSQKSVIFKIKSKIHLVNTVLYLLGKESRTGIPCHNSNTGLTYQEKSVIRRQVMAGAPSFQYSARELEAQRRYMGKDENNKLDEILVYAGKLSPKSKNQYYFKKHTHT